jgi:L-lactate dehydrogenase
MELASANADICRRLVPRLQKVAPDALFLLVTNPVDVITYVTLKLTGLPPGRVLGSGTVLDSSRFRFLIADRCNVAVQNVHAYIVGEHGDSEVPVWSLANIAGMRLEAYCAMNGLTLDTGALQQIFEQTRDAAYHIIERKGATYFAVAAGLMRIVEAILRDQGTVLSVSTLLEAGAFGEVDVCLSLPTVVGRGGAQRVLRLDLSPSEAEALNRSADVLRATIRQLGLPDADR